ncbi:MAG: hypothetical protein ACJ0BK_00915 [Coraliomargaritaceae bacterium]
MTYSSDTSSRSTFILALWSLLFTKCFTLEYLVRHYEAPISSLSYVWALSITMAGVATVVYANIQAEVRNKLLKHPNFLVILTLALFIVILVAKSLSTTDGVSHSLALAATGLSIIQLLVHGKDLKSRSFGTSISWLIAAVAILNTAQPLAFFVFAMSICIISFLPRALQFVSLRRGELHS